MNHIARLVISLFLVVGTPFVVTAGNVNINIGVGVPPPLEFAAPPDVVVVPSGTSDVYLVPNTVGLYFYGGFWYRFHENHWFRATLYSGPWRTIVATLVPRSVVVIPPDYVLSMPQGYHRIRYNDFHSHWKNWGHNHYWNKQTWYRDHAQHHWGGRDFHQPPVNRTGDVHRSTPAGHDQGGHQGGQQHQANRQHQQQGQNLHHE